MIEIPKMLDRARSGFEAARDKGKRGGVPCAEDGCLGRTYEGKPYCREHVDRMPYVAEMLARAERREQELRGAKAPLVLLDEAVNTLADVAEREPRITTGKLAKLLGCDLEVAEKIVKLLKLKRERTKRGVPIYRIRRAS